MGDHDLETGLQLGALRGELTGINREIKSIREGQAQLDQKWTAELRHHEEENAKRHKELAISVEAIKHDLIAEMAKKRVRGAIWTGAKSVGGAVLIAGASFFAGAANAWFNGSRGPHP